MSLVGRVYGFYSRLRHRYKDRMNKSRVTFCGSGTVIYGYVDARGSTCRISIGNACAIQGMLVTEHDDAEIIIGNNVFIGADTIVDCARQIIIEDNALVSYQCLLMDSNNHSARASERAGDLRTVMSGAEHAWEQVPSAPIRIGKGAWLGARCIILKGVSVGEGAVVGAGSVVTKDVPPHTVVAGNPARIIREVGAGG